MALRTVQIGDYQTLEELARACQNAINSVVSQINRESATQIIDAQNRRVSRVADPGNGGDAVNLRTLKRALKKQTGDITNVVNSITGGVGGGAEINYVDYTLDTTGTYTMTVPPSASDDSLVMYTLTRGTAAGQVVEWPAGIFAQSYYVGTEVSSSDVFIFRKKTGPVMDYVSHSVINRTDV